MKVKNNHEAWEKVNEIFPTDYEQDLKSTETAGYPVYRSTAEGHYYDYICDLGDRLEVNRSDGTTVNIWIEREQPDKVAEGVKAMKAAENIGGNLNPMFGHQQYTKVTFCIDGEFGGADTKLIYDGLLRGESWLIAEVIVSYCEANGIKWGTITDTKSIHYRHGDKSIGHFIIEGYISLREET